MSKDLLKFKQQQQLSGGASTEQEPKGQEKQAGAKPKKKTSGKPIRRSARKAAEKNIKIKKAESIVRKAKKNRKGSWSEAVQNRHRVKTLLKMYICPVKICGKKKGSKKALLRHIADVHKKFHFNCRYCTKTYQTYIGCYKHEKYYLHGKPFGCQYCTKTFQFEGERDEHLRKHTRKNLWICELDNCNKGYASKRAMKAHVKSHYDEEVVCQHVLKNGKECGQICIDTVNLKQHERGMHGEGWVTPCGIRYSWPGPMYKHRRECDDCQDILEKKKKNFFCILFASNILQRVVFLHIIIIAVGNL